eukprot:524437-Rhodomonas_salina.7
MQRMVQRQYALIPFVCDEEPDGTVPTILLRLCYAMSGKTQYLKWMPEVRCGTEGYQCPALTAGMPLRICYTKSGTVLRLDSTDPL